MPITISTRMENQIRPLKERTEQSLFWSVLNNGTLQVLNILFGIVLARLLTPGDYGIVGVLTIFTLIAGNLQSSGFTQALINLKEPKANDYNSVFWFNIIAGITLYIILWLCAPLIASFFHQPVLIDVSRFVFITVPISAFGIAHAAYMNKNMMNREVAIINAIALLCSGATGITLAFNGYAYWSLAWQQVIYIVVLNFGRYHFVSWHPSWKVDFTPVKHMFSFAVNILFTNIINTLSGQILTFIFGRLFNISQVGNYAQANKWNTQAHTFVSGSLIQVVQTVLVSVNEDKQRQKRVFRKMMRFTSFLSFPVMIGLIVIAKEFIGILGEKWSDSVPLLQILCFAGAFMPFYALYQHLAIGCKRSDIYLWCNVGQIILQISAILLCYYVFSKSIVVVVSVYSIVIILWLITWQIVAKRLIDLKWHETLLDILPFFFITVVLFGIVYFISLYIDNSILRLIVKIVLCMALYISTMKLAKVKIFAESWEFLKQKMLHR